MRGENQSVNIAAGINSSGDLIVDDKKLSEQFNLIFSNLGQSFCREFESAPIYKAHNESFSISRNTEKTSYDVLKQKSPFAKYMHGQLLMVEKILFPHLTFALSVSKRDCVSPSMLKSAVITPFFEKVDIYDPLNHRSFSITTPFAKILEKCLPKKPTAYAESRGIHIPFQFGFRSEIFAQKAIL